jgi:RNA polymerase sigma-70 factor (ECF subfamily)
LGYQQLIAPDPTTDRARTSETTSRQQVAERVAALGLTCEERATLLADFDASPPDVQAVLAKLEGPDLVDFSLMCRVKQGDGGAFASLAARLTPAVQSVLRRGFRHGDVGPACLEVLARLWEKRALYDARKGTLAAWAAGIARNLLRDAFRGKRRGPALVSIDNPGGRALPLVAKGADPADTVMAKDDVERVRRELGRVLAQVRPPMRRAWEMLFDQGLSYAEIARRLRRPQGTIATWIYRIRQSVARAL